MRYTEQSDDFKLDSFYDWIRTIVILVIIGPLRLVKEISTKVIYLDRKVLKRVLFTACLLEGFITVLQVIINNILLGRPFSLLLGKVPILVQLIVLIILCSGAYLYCIYDFIIYQQLNKFFPLVTGVDVTETASEENKDEQDSPLEDIKSFDDLNDIINQAVKQDESEDAEDDIVSDNTEVDTSEIDLSGIFNDLNDNFFDSVETASVADETATDCFDPLINPDIYENEDVFKFQNKIDLTFRDLDESQIEYKGDLDTEEKASVEDNMISSRDPSKYISEDNLGLFLSRIGVDNFGTIDDLSSWCTPKDFALAT